ncbi:MAG: VanZ family protein [Methylophilus sp.]
MKQLSLLNIRIMQLLFGCCIAAIAVMAIIPSADIPKIFHFWDKVQHALAFTILSLTGSLAYPRNTKAVLIGLILYGASIEVIQKYFTSTHISDVSDLLADSLGIMIGIAIYLIIRKFTKLLVREI